jgi:hypothetical protein
VGFEPTIPQVTGRAEALDLTLGTLLPFPGIKPRMPIPPPTAIGIVVRQNQYMEVILQRWMMEAPHVNSSTCHCRIVFAADHIEKNAMVATILIPFMTMSVIALAAQPTSQSKPHADAVVVAWVLGEPIYQKDVMDEDPNMDRHMRGILAVGPEERLQAYYAMRLFDRIIIPLRACYLESHSQQATPVELGAYFGEEYRHAELRRRKASWRLERIQQELERKDLKPQEMADLLRDECLSMLWITCGSRSRWKAGSFRG